MNDGKMKLKQLRFSAVPLVGIETQDPAQTVAGILNEFNGKAKELAVLQWDIARGWTAITSPGSRFVASSDLGRMTLGESLAFMSQNAPPGAILFIHGAHRVLERDGVAQGVWLCRDSFKALSPPATLVLLGPTVPLPPEIASDVVVYAEPPPDAQAVAEVVSSLYSDALKAAKAKGVELPPMSPELGKRATDAALGLLSRFDVEQTVSLAITKDGLDVGEIWRRKVARVKLQSGAEIWTNCAGFESLAGCANIKGFLRSYINGRRPPGCVLFLDEIEKMLAGAGTDTSGVTGKMLGQFLTWTQDRQVDGVLLLGVPGSGKSATAKAAAGEAGVPCFRLSFAEAQGSLVGESEKNLRAALASVDAISGGKILMIATCNSVEALAPELIGRFRLGTFFYDYPDEQENAALWDMYLRRYQLPPETVLPPSQNWVGREIESACYQAWLFGKSVSEVVQYVVPQCVSQRAKLEALRQSASGRFLSASFPGVFGLEQRAAATRFVGI